MNSGFDAMMSNRRPIFWWGWSFLVLLPVAARAQSPELVDAIRVHRPGVAQVALEELGRCETARCPELGRLSLLAGMLVLSAGDAAQAASLLSRRPPPPGLEAFHAWYLGEALSYSGQKPQALKAWKAVKAPDWLAQKAALRAAEVQLDLGQYKKALPALETAGADGSPELLYARGLARLLGGKAKEGRADLRAVAFRYPAHPHAALAAQRLGAIAWSTAEHLARAATLRLQGALELADAELDAIGADPGRYRAAAALERAQLRFAQGKEGEAQGLLDLALGGPRAVAVDALMIRARKLMRASRNDEARSIFKLILERYGDDPAADEAAYFGGWIAFQSGAYGVAIAELGELPRRFPRSNHQDEALWFGGFAAYRMGQLEEARARLGQLAGQFPGSPLLPQARYWAARALQGQPNPSAPELAAEYGDLIRVYRPTLYALLSQLRLKELGLPAPEIFDTRPVSRPGSSPKLRLAQTLAAAGLLRDVGEEVQHVVGSVGGATEALAIGPALQALGEYGAAHALASRFLWRATYVEQDPAALALMYPKAYEPLVERSARAAALDPYFAWAIMRRESAFRPEVASGADARGLMQIIPPTARRIATDLRLPEPEPDDLFAPELNVTLGTAYLSALLKRFQHQTLAAGAYNGGPQAVARWAQAKPALPLDEWIEEIPYKETRGYVKQVTADAFIYRTLYGAPQQPLSLEVPAPLDGGVSY